MPMILVRALALGSLVSVSSLFGLGSGAIGCGGTPPQATKAPVAEAHADAPPASEMKLPPSPVAANPNTAVNLSDDILRACAIVDSSERAPKFDFDSNDLSTQEKDILSQVAKCLTIGPLKGRAVRLVGRADPRGETEYNMTLGAKRADTVKGYLSNLGVDKAKMAETSRGELDAIGTDEPGWNKDRRVDVDLLK